MSFRDVDIHGTYSAGDDALNTFYVPLLKRAVSYDRIAGYFSSMALVVAASGVSRFVAAGGQMRLIVGAQLVEEDVKAITVGEPLTEVLARRLLTDPLTATDVVVRHRLETLAFLVEQGRLRIKIGVPTDETGKPLPAHKTSAYFHSKFGILRDVDGNNVAFIGSDNESASGWRRHHETFSVAVSWMPEVWAFQGEDLVRRFESQWNGTPDRGWEIVELPEAVEQQLLKFSKPEPPPARDPVEKVSPGPSRLAEIVAAPRVGGGTGVGFVTAGVISWPHQSAIAKRAVETYPRGYLLADEVGLGKTIEAGLIIRELLVSGAAERILLLVPASVMRQWQEELAEKFALNIPRFDTGTFVDVIDREVGKPGQDLWAALPVMLASSHLARRRSQRTAILSAGPWDVVLVDEAHHARRRGSKATDTPNALLTLLQAMKNRRMWKALYLASATPMQMHVHEAWDLLELLDVPGRWGRGSQEFVHYFEQLREGFVTREWDFLQEMAKDHFSDRAVRSDPVIEETVKKNLGGPKSRFIRKFPEEGLSRTSAEQVSHEARMMMDEYLRANNPMRDRVFRTTRNLLRSYRERGILDPATVIPNRDVSDAFFTMTESERRLYDRIERYISRYYDLYMGGSGTQKPLGFIMTIYRRRLTSSFWAIRNSLRKRLVTLEGKTALKEMLDFDDVATLETTELFDFDALGGMADAIQEEIKELRDFVAELEDQPPDETKMEHLYDELSKAFKGRHDTALVFSQYYDTLDYIRRQLLPVYKDRLVLYSGMHGGERYDQKQNGFVRLSKEQVKELFREGREVKILLGTDSLSEGLNLQTCAKLINYDMPWNFMRVEQRIGRIDRIGGKELVEISNYFYDDTVEEQIYRGIAEDFDWFQDVVGPAQPVLAQVEKAIEQVAMRTPDAARRRETTLRINKIRSQIEEARAEALTISSFEGAPDPSARLDTPSMDLAQLEEILTSVPETARMLHSHPDLHGAYLLETESGKVEVTFDLKVLDRHGPRIRLLTYGTPELKELLAAGGADVTTLWSIGSVAPPRDA